MDLITVKVIALSLLGGISLILGFLPLKLGSLIDTSDFEGGRNFWKRTITSVLLCFGGGVLLATSFVHMLPEVLPILIGTHIDFIILLYLLDTIGDMETRIKSQNQISKSILASKSCSGSNSFKAVYVLNHFILYDVSSIRSF